MITSSFRIPVQQSNSVQILHRKTWAHTWVNTQRDVWVVRRCNDLVLLTDQLFLGTVKARCAVLGCFSYLLLTPAFLLFGLLIVYKTSLAVLGYRIAQNCAGYYTTPYGLPGKMAVCARGF